MTFFGWPSLVAFRNVNNAKTFSEQNTVSLENNTDSVLTEVSQYVKHLLKGNKLSGEEYSDEWENCFCAA